MKKNKKGKVVFFINKKNMKETKGLMYYFLAMDTCGIVYRIWSNNKRFVNLYYSSNRVIEVS